MADQDAQDINQMMSASADAVIKPPKKSMMLWIVLGCMVVGVGLGIFVYQQSLTPVSKVKPTPKPSVVVSESPIPSPEVPEIDVINPVPNNMTFPKKGRLRVYYMLTNDTPIDIVLDITINNVKISIFIFY